MYEVGSTTQYFSRRSVVAQPSRVYRREPAQPWDDYGAREPGGNIILSINHICVGRPSTTYRYFRQRRRQNGDIPGSGTRHDSGIRRPAQFAGARHVAGGDFFLRAFYSCSQHVNVCIVWNTPFGAPSTTKRRFRHSVNTPAGGPLFVIWRVHSVFSRATLRPVHL